MRRRDFLALTLLAFVRRGFALNKDLRVLGCSVKGDRLYRVETHRMLFQWVKHEGGDLYSVGMMSILAALTYPLYSVRVKPVGTELERDDNLATVEAGKRIATFPSPLSGRIEEINEEVVRDPKTVNVKPYSTWIVKIRAARAEELGELVGASEAAKRIKDVILEEDIDCSIVEE
ncbi:MAG TPA: glycine cleavage system protein H [Aquifex aeolicus]|nr:glycine cleavage system protein H [Aquifex aeolicus]